MSAARVILVGTRPARVERLQHLADAVVIAPGERTRSKKRAWRSAAMAAPTWY